MRIRIGCQFAFEVPSPTHAVLMVEPHTSEVDRIVRSRLAVGQGVHPTRTIDSFGNRCQRLTLPAGLAQIAYVAEVDSPGDLDPVDEWAGALDPEHVPDSALQFLLPSRYCESDQLADLAWGMFGAAPAGWRRVQAVVDWVHERVEFDYARSSTTHTAASVLDGRVGVCRDFTHAGIALCRALNVPARYVFGYLPDIGVPDPGTPMDFCAWMEVLLDGGWYTFDVRNNQRRTGRVVVGRGRDAADVAMVTSFGNPTLLEMTVTADEAIARDHVTSA